MRLLVLTMAIQPSGPRAFILDWIRSLARKVDSLDVVANMAEPVELPPNVCVHSLGKERNHGSVRRALRFYRLLGEILGRRQIDACFCHQIPILGAAAGPVLKFRGIPLVTWFAHPALTWQTKLAHRLSTRVVSVIPESYPYKRDRLVPIGQKIDVGLFCPAGEERRSEPPLILCVGRLSPIKDHPTLLEACAGLLGDRPDDDRFRLAIVGGPAVPSDRIYVTRLGEIVQRHGLEETVRFLPSMEREELPGWYRRAALHVNLSPAGSADKAPLEAMACATPSLVAHRGFGPTLGRYAKELTFEHGNAVDLAGKIESLLRLSGDRRREMGTYLRNRIVELHGLDGWTERLLAVLRDV